MANEIQELLKEIKDERLRSRLTAAVGELRKTKKFGLVFEDHLPELLPLYSARVRARARVARRDGKLTETFLVQRVAKGTATVVAEADGAPLDIPAAELVVVKRFGEAIFPALRHVESVLRGGDAPHHALIEADNYHALQLLEWLYAGKVDCIYIDPPYNTGARDWKYNNDYVDKADGWRHSKWLSMMKRRLLIARRLLRTDGVLLVTIDEHEVHHLATLLEELFPNYLRHIVCMVINPKGTGKHNFARVDEYAIFCVPNLGRSVISGMPQPGVATVSSEEVDADDADDVDDSADSDDSDSAEDAADAGGLPFPADEIDLWELRHARRRGGESSYRHQRPNQFYALLVDPKTQRVVRACESLHLEERPAFQKVKGLVPVWPIDAENNHRCWRFIPPKMQSLIDAGRVVLGRYNEARQTWTINIWERKPTSKKLKTVWWEPTHDAGTHGTMLLHKILGRRDAFPFPKSIYATRDAIAAVVRDRPNALVVDFFAGSGTTLHATTLLNDADGGKRTCVLVTNNEVQDREAKRLAKKGLGPGDDEWENKGICRSTTLPRCKFAINGRRDDGTEIAGEYLTGRFAQQDVRRAIRPLDFASITTVTAKRARESLAVVLGFSKSKVTGAEPFLLAEGESVAVLLELASLEDFIKQGKEWAGAIETVYLPTPSGKVFNQAKEQLAEAWPPLIRTVEIRRPMKDGFIANMDYFRLEFLDRATVETGGKLADILPALWMMAGCRGSVPTCKGTERMLFFKDSPFAVLVEEGSLKPFLTKLAQRPDVTWVFLVTNDQDSFSRLCEWLPEHVPASQRIHLWRNYIDNFLINVDHVSAGDAP